MSVETLKQDNINSLCKKYFTPELCDEPVTESKRSLEFNIYTQLDKYGKKLYNEKYRYLNQEDLEDVLIDCISKCFDIWKRDKKDRSYSAYFAETFKHAAADFIGKKYNRQSKELSPETLENHSDKNASIDNVVERHDALMRAKKYFEFIDWCFKLKKRSEWYKPLLTCHLYEDLHEVYDLPELSDDLRKLSFVDMSVYLMNDKPTQKEIAKMLGKDAGQMSKAFDTFFMQVQEQYQESDLKKQMSEF